MSILPAWLLPAILLANPAVIVVEQPAQLALLSDGQGHFVAYRPDKPDDEVYYGDGKLFYRLAYRGIQPSHAFYFIDPRHALTWERQVVIHLKEQRYAVQCGSRETPLKPVAADQATRILSAARFERQPHAWQPYALSRDEHGNYYYVDRGRWPENEKKFRVFIGKKGDMKPTRLKDIVSDSEGDIFSTPRGELRLILDKQQATWIADKKRSTLTYVPVEKNMKMIYTELGVYLGAKLGTPCDAL